MKQNRGFLTRAALTTAIGTALPGIVAAQAPVRPSPHGGHAATVVTAPNGTPVVNIVAPNTRGLSHNVYSRFDVDKKGLILNNSAPLSKTRLAGYIYGNAHLKASGPARVILNEVTSTRASQLSGYLEVAGTPAEMIVANPNGITCNGCGFINTPRAVLTTGTPLLGADGSLAGFGVTQGAITVEGAGLDASHIDRVDVLTRALKVNGKLWARQLNVVTGANRIDAATLSTQAIPGTGTAPSVSIDVAKLGGMYANAIHLVGTEVGVGVNVQGNMAAQAGDFTLTSAGQIVLDGTSSLYAAGDLDLSAQALAQAGTMETGQALHVRTTDAATNSGTAYAFTNSQWQVGGTLTNTHLLASGENTRVVAVNLANNGTLAAGITPDGKVGQAGNLDVSTRQALQATGRNLAAGNVHLSGATLDLGDSQTLANDGIRLTATTGDIRLASGALVNSAHTTLAAAQTLDNGGHVEGGNVSLTAATLDNHGTIIGATLIAHADNLVNGTDLGPQTDNTPYQSAFMAATGDLDLYVTGSLLNRDATLFSLGDMTLAADSTGHRSQAITNTSGDIDAAGNLTLAADQITNQRRLVDFQTFPVSGNDVVGWDGDASGEPAPADANTRTDSRWMTLAQAGSAMRNRCAQGGHSVNWRCKPGAYVQQTDTWTVPSATVLVTASTESHLLAGNTLAIDGSLLNDASTVATGGDLIIDGITKSGEVDSGPVGADSVRNMARVPTVNVAHTRTQSITRQREKSCALHTKHCWRDRGQVTLTFHDTQPPADGNMNWVTLDLGPTLAAHITAGNSVVTDAGRIDNQVVGPDGQPVNGAVGLGNGPSTLPDNGLGVPHPGLYTLHTSPDASYLVETDPRFANYGNFISSDYMLERLGYDPATIGKRMGDGFYEQRHVLEQVTDLTGRRFLADGRDAMAQYRALMNNAVVAAQKFNLTVGVALTAPQIAALTQDVVWLVREQIDGQSVLVPVVYLGQASANELGQPGAVIAGRHVVLDAHGTITNNGTLAAAAEALIHAGSLLNSGRITTGGNLGIQTAQNLLNQGGILEGADVALVAGGDIDSSAAVGPVNLGDVDLGSVPVGSITASHDLRVTAGHDLTLNQAALNAAENLDLTAGRDLSATAASVHAGQDLTVQAGRDIALQHGTATQRSSYDGYTRAITTTQHVSQLSSGHQVNLIAGRDVTSAGAHVQAGSALTLQAGRDTTLGAVADTQFTQTQWRHGHARTITTTRHVSQLSAGHQVNLIADRDVTSAGAHVQAGSALTLQAGRDITLGAVADTQFTQTQWRHGHTHGTTATRDDTLHGTTLAGATGVHVAAGHDATLIAADVASSTGNVTLSAGHDLKVDAGHEEHDWRQDTYSHHSSMFSSKTTTVTDDVVARNAIGTVISGDTINLQSQGDMALTGAAVAASNGLSLVSAGAISIGAATNTRQEDYQKTVTHSGLLSGGSIGFTIGKRTQKTTSHTTDNLLTGSIAGTLAGDSNANAKTTYTQTASSLLSHDGNVSIRAGAVNIAAGHESEQQTVDTLFKQSGLTVAVGGGAIGALEGAVQSGSNLWDTAKASGSGRVNALVAANAAVVGYQGYKAASNVANQLGSSSGGGAGLSVSLTYGVSKATTHSLTNATQAVGSSVSGQNVNIVANGTDGTSGDATITGSSVNAVQNLALVAAHDLTINAAQDTYDNTTTNKSESGSVGVAASFGQGGMAIGVTVSAAYGHGNANTSSVHQVNSQVSAGKTLNFVSGADTTLAGAVLSANQVQGVVGGDLTIHSLQDTSRSHGTQTNMSASATFGYGASVSASYGHASSHANYADVVQQSGIEAGNGGFQVAVGGNTSLVGGLLTSNQTAVNDGLNTLTTGTLITRDLHNVSDGSASTVGLGASLNTGATFGQALKDDPDNKNHADPGNDNYLAANGGKYGLGRAVVQNLMNHGNASRSSSGQTLSAVSAGAIQVRGTTPGAVQTIATLEASARTGTNTQATAPDMTTLQNSATDEQTGNQLLFNAGAWAANQPALRSYLAGLQQVVRCNINPSAKSCHATALSGGYWMQKDSSTNIFTNGIMNNAIDAGNNAGDAGVLYTTPSTASDTYVLNVYVPKVSGIASLLGGLIDSLNVNHANGALGSTAGAQLNANIAGQIKQANGQGAGIQLTEFAHSDGTTQLAMATMQNPSAFNNVNGVGNPLRIMNAEGSANADTEQAAINGLGINANVFYSCNPNDPVCSSGLLGHNPSTGGNPQSLFTAGPFYYGKNGWGLETGGLTGTSAHSDAWYSAAVIPVAAFGSATQYAWGSSPANSATPGNAPNFVAAADAPSGAQPPTPFLQYGGTRDFATLSQDRSTDDSYLHVPTYTVAGSTPWNVNIASLVWPGGATANLSTALRALNGLPMGVTTPEGPSGFAPGSSRAIPAPARPANSPTGQTQQQNTMTPAQWRCLALTNNATQCVQ